eukprot:1779841-Alexandrium_andersonii.AAC.1
MSASLVGSEMCIRDRVTPLATSLALIGMPAPATGRAPAASPLVVWLQTAPAAAEFLFGVSFAPEGESFFAEGARSDLDRSRSGALALSGPPNRGGGSCAW